MDEKAKLLASLKGIRKEWKRRPEILLHPQIPKPLHGLAPRVLLGQAWWDRARRGAYRSTNNHCVACGKHKSQTIEGWLKAHELYRIDYRKGRMTYVEAVPLCHLCHGFIHLGRMEVLLDEGAITQATFDGVVNHGTRVLKEAGLKKRKPYVGQCMRWADWRLVIDGVEYPPKYASEKEWLEAYA